MSLPPGFSEAAKDWDVALAGGREFSLGDWYMLTFGEQARYIKAERELISRADVPPSPGEKSLRGTSAMNDPTRDPSGLNAARRTDPGLNQSGDPRNPGESSVRAEEAATGEDRHDAAGARADAGQHRQDQNRGTPAPLPNGLGTRDEFRIGRITLTTSGDGALALKHENVGTETQVAEAVLEGLLEEHFFTRKIGDVDADKARARGDSAKS